MTELIELDDDKYRGMREYSRVDAYLPVAVRSLTGEEKLGARSRSSVESALTDQPALPHIEDKALSECLQIISSKLDTILKMLAFQAKGHNLLRFTNVNISAGGISIALEETYRTGEFLEVRLMLPTVPYNIFYVYGDVVKSEPVGGKIFVFVEFTEIDEDIREQIVKYVFERQRELIRKKRSQ